MPLTKTSAPGRHCKNRVFEWAAASAILGMGLEEFFWPGSIAASKFQFMLEMLGSSTLMVFYFVVGLDRLGGLWINSSWPKGSSFLRSIGAIGGAAVWAQMGISLIISQWGSTPPPSLPLYIALVGAELYSAYRAAADARFR